jgi:hypothetical protein
VDALGSTSEEPGSGAKLNAAGWRRNVLGPLLALGPQVSTDSPQFGNKEVRPFGRDLECFRDATTYDMGPYLRCLAMYRLVCERLNVVAKGEQSDRWRRLPTYNRSKWPTLKEVAAVLLERAGEQRDEKLADWLRSLLSHDEAAGKMMPAKHYTDQVPQIVDSELIEAIQRRLTATKTLVILDGIEQCSGPFAALFNAMRGMDWQPLIRSLLQVDEKLMLQQSGRYMSRLVLLSNSPLGRIRAWLPCDPFRLPHVADPTTGRATAEGQRGQA